ncbi:hypothetical protein EV643_1275 [Kribbella sp. VKM Ac-2527]|uniref:Uncharacterized protein n=2 Tax=Kribbella caucasensis TaxID=2512215 RepID=A0A4R6JH03_9ACTN|nr:hypothetical protein EV643_1275 [Kribbella sp. VKM Ac-2527]
MIGVSALVSGDDSGRSTGAGQGASSADDGWRWESYQTIELQVPEDWGYGITGSPPCLVEKKQRPHVGRPGPVRTIGCWGLPPLAHRAPYVWFDTKSRNPAGDGMRKLGVQPADHGWVEETRLVDGLHVTVLSDDDSLRRRILDSARVIDGSDANGCTPDHRLAHQPDGRPASTGGLASIGTVESIKVCRYAITRRDPDRRAPLIASSIFTGDAAGALVDAITSAPEGSGPNDKECIDTYGMYILVLTVRGGSRDQEVSVRYDGCDFNGTDDGQTLRQLTAPVLRPILTGIHQPWHYHGSLYELVVGPQPSK